MLVNVKLDVETLEYRLSSKLFRGSVNNPKAEWDSQPHCEASLTGREEVRFNSNSDTTDGHNPKGGFN